MMDYIRRSPQGGVLQIEGIMRNVPPMMAMAIAMGLHVRVGIEDNIWRRKGERFNVRAAGRAGGAHGAGTRPRRRHREDARRIMKIGTWYDSAEETLAALGMAPNRKPGQRDSLSRIRKRTPSVVGVGRPAAARRPGRPARTGRRSRVARSARCRSCRNHARRRATTPGSCSSRSASARR